MSIMVDEKDMRILVELKKNSRNSTKNIASNVKIPRITVRDRIQKMIDNKIIKSFTIILNHEKLGFATTAFIFVATNPCESNISIENIANKIAKFSGVYEIHIVSGEYDLLIKTRGKTFDDIGMRYLLVTAYDADLSDENLLVVDEFIMNKDGKKYRIMSTRQGDILFDDAQSFHYLALRDKKFFLVEERIDGK